MEELKKSRQALVDKPIPGLANQAVTMNTILQTMESDPREASFVWIDLGRLNNVKLLEILCR